jgi:hypothetical protein
MLEFYTKSNSCAINSVFDIQCTSYVSRAQGREFLVSPINTKASPFIEGVGKIIIFYFEENSLIL